jgi:membrane protein YdbS with pleckstrin-like domain
MNCMNCGTSLPSEARFCAGCGLPVDTELTRLAATRTPPLQQAQPLVYAPSMPPAQPPIQQRRRDQISDAEQVIFTARPTLLFVGLGYALAALAAVLLMALLGFTGWVTSPFILVPLGLAILLIPAYHHLKRNMVRYTLTDSKIEIDRGLVSRTTRNIPLRNIQDVTVSISFLQRLLGFGDIVIDDASQQTGHTVLDNIPNPRRHADLLLRELRRWK